jgi:hypothetical protein
MQLLPLELTVLQCKDYADAAEAFAMHVGSFQGNWKDVITRTDRGLGNYAYETRASIFWTRLTTFVLIESSPDASETTGK